MLTYKQAAVDQALCFFDKDRSLRLYIPLQAIVEVENEPILQVLSNFRARIFTSGTGH
jgi:hypothetical protein